MPKECKSDYHWRKWQLIRHLIHLLFLRARVVYSWLSQYGTAVEHENNANEVDTTLIGTTINRHKNQEK